MKTLRRSWVLTIGLVTCCSALTAQAIVFVDDSATGGNDGTSWADAYTSLKAAVDNSPAASEIWAATGTYTPGTARTDSFVMKEGMALYGGFAGGETERSQRDWEANTTILSGETQGDADPANNVYHILIANTNAVLDGFVLTGGMATGADPADKGGAVYGWYVGRDNSDNWPQTIVNCVFTNNTATYGGAVYGYYSNYRMENCLFADNTALTHGGGAYLDHFSNWRKVEMLDCTFRQNTAVSQGGAIFGTYFQKWPITSCRFIGNTAGSSGGAISHNSPWMADGLYECLFVENTSGANGGALNYGNPGLKIYDSLFVRNNAPAGSGGAGNPFNQFAVVRDSQFVGNVARNSGGALSANVRDFEARDSLFVGNVASNDNGGAISLTLGWYNPPRPAMPENLTVFGNFANKLGGGMQVAAGKPVTNINCIFWGNVTTVSDDQLSGDSVVCRYCDVEEDWPVGTGDIDADPLFAGGPSGTWTAVGTYDPTTGQTVLTDGTASWTPGAYAGACLNPETTQYLQVVVVTNTATSMTVWGNAASLASVGSAYQVWDYHLKSKEGRRTPLGWTVDAVTSPCIDAGDPSSDYSNEPSPNGDRVNMGVYGNSLEASKTPPPPPSATLMIVR